MKPTIIKTADKSHTLFMPELNEHYHSIFGAIQESKHIYIQNGFNQIKKPTFKILEIGFGTGLNCFLSWLETEKQNKTVFYYGIEKYPIDIELVRQLNYPQILNKNWQKKFEKLHQADWDKMHTITNNFILYKAKADLIESKILGNFDLVYFDAFSPDVQPEMWTKEVFDKIFKVMSKNAIMLTYSSKGMVKNVLKNVGFLIQRLQGPSGKKHILRAKK